MGSLFSRPSKSQKFKDPKWQGIGPNTPRPVDPSSTFSNSSQSGYYGRQNGADAESQPRSQALTTLDSRTSKPLATTKKSKPNKAPSKIMLLLKLDPKGGAQRRVITKNLISLPSEFRHTGHIGAGEVRSGQIDPEKIKNQMAEVAACLKLDVNSPMPMLKTMPVQPEDRDSSYSGPEQVDRYAARPGKRVAVF
ncbi:hypothetical protein KVV02_000251 [Mortierella alpina]|uniref:CRIB domain-containing protein n=1 Tax=Mortierella alpina TaxID=64518 RepID=A0A9P8D3H8_MORAP|nr:hypothetical protein KVV02_000251 [Mortierella alpina]